MRVTLFMHELDFSDQIKAANFNFTPKTQKFGAFKLSENGEKFIQSIASETNGEILASVAQNAFEAAKNFHRVGFSDLEVAVARICRYAKYGDAKMLTSEHSNLSDLEFALAKVTVAQNKLKTEDFLTAAKIEIEVEDEENEEDEDEGETCDCEKPDMQETDGKKTCASCGKPAKAKKNC